MSLGQQSVEDLDVVRSENTWNLSRSFTRCDKKKVAERQALPPSLYYKRTTRDDFLADRLTATYLLRR